MTTSQVETIQSSLVDVWQNRIKEWHEAAGMDQPTPGSSGSGGQQPNMRPNQTVEENMEPLRRDITENGHVIRKIPGAEGIFCCKCGKQTACMKQRKQKITGKKCEMADRPESQWQESPGAWRGQAHLDKAREELAKHNKGGHDLEWNGKLGKVPGEADEGTIVCKKCERAWSWRDRVNNLPRTTCAGDAVSAEAERKKSIAGIEAWEAQKLGTHALFYDKRMLRWHCRKCTVRGTYGFGERFKKQVNVKCTSSLKRPLESIADAPPEGPLPSKRLRGDQPVEPWFPKVGVG